MASPRISASTMTVCLLLLLALLPGCRKKESAQPPAPKPETPGIPVPIQKGAEAGKWKGVKIGITDRKMNRDLIAPVDIGSSLAVPETGLTVKVDYFFPDFVMKSGKVTSRSNELKNPAASITITDNDTRDAKTGKNLVLTGYLFGRIHNNALDHPRYNFVLVDGIPRQ